MMDFEVYRDFGDPIHLITKKDLIKQKYYQIELHSPSMQPYKPTLPEIARPLLIVELRSNGPSGEWMLTSYSLVVVSKNRPRLT